MNLKRKTSLNWLIMLMWQKDQLPESICTYFWTALFTLVSTIIFLPLVLITLIVPRFRKWVDVVRGGLIKTPGATYFAITYFGLIVTAIFGYHIIEDIFKYDLHPTLLHILYSFLAGVGAILALVLTIVIIYYIVASLRKSVSTINSTVSDTIVGQFIQAKKDKICPPIDYID